MDIDTPMDSQKDDPWNPCMFGLHMWLFWGIYVNFRGVTLDMLEFHVGYRRSKLDWIGFGDSDSFGKDLPSQPFLSRRLAEKKRLMSWKAVHLFLNVIMVRGNHFCDKFCQRQQKHRSAQKAGTSVCCCCCSPGDPVEIFFCNFQVDLIGLWLWNHSPCLGRKNTFRLFVFSVMPWN